MVDKVFTLEQMTRSDIAASNEWDNTPSDEVVANLWHVESVLRSIRDAYMRSHNEDLGFNCNRGIRGIEMNKYGTGASDSQHLLGEALNFHVHLIREFEPNRTRDLFWFCCENRADFPEVDQMIYYNYEHVDDDEPGNTMTFDSIYLSSKRKNGPNRGEYMVSLRPDSLFINTELSRIGRTSD